MKHNLFSCLLFTVAAMAGLLSTIPGQTRAAAEAGTLLWSAADPQGETAKYVYIIGGYYDPDRGGTWPWGNTEYRLVRFIGDTMGEIILEYQDGTRDTVPLIYGYTLWWHEQWNMASLPFRGKGADEELSGLLQKTLCLYGAYEGRAACAFRIAADAAKTLKSVRLLDNPEKDGTPVICGVHVFGEEPEGVMRGGEGKESYTVDAGDAFYDTHTIDSRQPLPEETVSALQTLCRGIATTAEDWLNAPEFTYAQTYSGPEIYFTGTPYANIANGVLQFSLTDIATRADKSGLLSESLDQTEQYLYGGFGTYNIGTAYNNRMWSRNKAMLVLNGYGFTDRAEHTLHFVNEAMMYFPNKGLSILGVPIPGHFTIIINEPMHYRNTDFELTKYNNPEIYGKDCWNLGNMEQDGHGMMMLSNWSIWKSHGSDPQWVEDNWVYINEAAEWILWCFAHADITFCTNDVLYAESEGVAGWMGYSLYCNQPCYLGLLAYIEMAETAGKTEAAARWGTCAEQFGQGILNYFTAEDGGWDFSQEGKDRDPTLAYMRYLYGYDTADMNQDWLQRTINSYDADLAEMLECGGYWGPWGTGYDQCTMLQTALLLDQMADATKLMNNLSKICYSPRHPDPYGVPEAFAVDTRKEIIRRTGDFENQIHTSEALSCYLLTMGVSPVIQDKTVLKIMPRLAQDWNVSVADFPVEHTSARLGLDVAYPKGGVQTASVTFHAMDQLQTVKYRFGPFPANTDRVAVTVNGKSVSSELVQSGDSKWAWITFQPAEGDTYALKAECTHNAAGSRIPTALWAGLLALIPCAAAGIFAGRRLRRSKVRKSRPADEANQ